MPARTLGSSLAASPQPTRLPRSTRSATALLCAATLTMAAASSCSSSSPSSASVGGTAAHHLTAYVSGDTNIQKPTRTRRGLRVSVRQALSYAVAPAVRGEEAASEAEAA